MSTTAHKALTFLALSFVSACGPPSDCEVYAKKAVECTQRHIDNVKLNIVPGFFTVERAELQCESWLENENAGQMRAEIECSRKLDDCRALAKCTLEAYRVHAPDSCRNSPKPWCPKSR